MVYQITQAEFAPVPGPTELVASIDGNVTWLSASLSSAVAPSTLLVGINPGGLAVGLYSSGAIVESSDPATKQEWYVHLTVVDSTTPTITSILNAASFINRASPNTSQQAPPFTNVAAAPGEIISIFGYSLGPGAPVGLQLDSSGKVATELGGVQVLFDGYAAPLTYVSATQINCVVPYELINVPGDIAPVQIKRSGVPLVLLQWDGVPVLMPDLFSAAPGIFTATGTGTGQAAALNSDLTVNSATNPAAAGSTVAVYMTGEGQTSPPGVTGSVTCAAGCATANQIPKPVLPVTAFVGGRPATIAFYGEAPGLVSGVMQVNLVIPQSTPSGSASLSITVGSSTQAGVTITVK